MPVAPSGDLSAMISQIEAEMLAAAEELRFEEAALLRDELALLRAQDPEEAAMLAPEGARPTDG